jgi:hypothetical protein
MYRRMTKKEKDLKTFNLQVYLHKESLKTVSITIKEDAFIYHQILNPDIENYSRWQSIIILQSRRQIRFFLES